MRINSKNNGNELTLVTGAAGFIGFHLCRNLLEQGRPVLGIDNLNDYYSVDLKRSRLKLLEEYGEFIFKELDICEASAIEEIFQAFSPRKVVNLAAQAGVRHSLKAPEVYVDTNIKGFLNILEGCRHQNVDHFVFASSSSVYGLNRKMPFSVHDNVDHPISLYAATKKSNELMAHAYSHLFGIPCTGLRFFTVYGPWGRPDMALFLFTDAILKRQPIKVFNHGRMKRDFTYIDDIVEGVGRVMDSPPKGDADWNPASPDPAVSPAPYRIYNIGSNNPVNLMDYVAAIENALGMTAEKELLPMQPGDVEASHADVDDIVQDFDYMPGTPVKEGVRIFIEWYRDYFKV